MPIDQLPPQEQLPAAPLLVGAYVVRAGGAVRATSCRWRGGSATVQREVERLERDVKRSGRA